MKEPLLTKSKLFYYSLIGFIMLLAIGNYFYIKIKNFLNKCC